MPRIFISIAVVTVKVSHGVFERQSQQFRAAKSYTIMQVLPCCSTPPWEWNVRVNGDKRSKIVGKRERHRAGWKAACRNQRRGRSGSPESLEQRRFNTARCILNLQGQKCRGRDRARRETRNGRGERKIHRNPLACWLAFTLDRP